MPKPNALALLREAMCREDLATDVVQYCLNGDAEWVVRETRTPAILSSGDAWVLQRAVQRVFPSTQLNVRLLRPGFVCITLPPGIIDDYSFAAA